MRIRITGPAGYVVTHPGPSGISISHRGGSACHCTMSDLSDLMALERERAKLEAQRDELLAALDKIAKYDEESIWCDSRDDAADAILEIAREAIAKAKA